VQAQCPECSTRFVIDDAKVPDRAFKVRCPRCQNPVLLDGRAGGAPAPAAPPPEAATAERPSAPPPSPAPPPPPSTPPAPLRREHTGSDKAADALIALTEPALASTFTGVLARLDYNVDVVEDVEEGTRLLEQGVYSVVVTTPPGATNAGRPETLAQRILRLPPDSRRRVFVVLVDPRFRTGDATLAWANQADLVVSPQDAASCEGYVRATVTEKRRLYQVFEDTRRRLEEA
jgi:predicted Zn finger-like uncharacterized protein